jgi:hypothetical protein
VVRNSSSTIHNCLYFSATSAVRREARYDGKGVLRTNTDLTAVQTITYSGRERAWHQDAADREGIVVQA